MPTDDVETAVSNDGVPIAVVDESLGHNHDITLQQVRCQATAYVNEDNDNFQTRAAIAPTFEEILQQQGNNPFSQHPAVLVRKAEGVCSVDKNVSVVRTDPIYITIQILVTKAHRSRLLSHSHYLVMTGHPCRRRMYDSMRRLPYCSHMANDVYSTAGNCPVCLREDSWHTLE